MRTPEGILPHSKKYKDRAWQNYTLTELGDWVHLLAKRSQHRTDPAAAIKDITDAQNYLDMMEAHLQDLRTRLSK